MKVFIDMDGVLCDIVSAILDYHHITFKVWPKGEYNIYKVARLNGYDGDIWEGLAEAYEYAKPMSDGFSYLNQYPDAYICTYALPHTETSKRVWLERHGILNKVIFIRDKWLLAKEGRLLIDDCDKNIELWEEAGGTGLLVPRIWNGG